MKTKQKLIRICLLCAVLLLSPALVQAFTYTTNNGVITLTRGGYDLSDYNGTGGIVISNFVNIIGYQAFAYDYGAPSLTSITIPGSVTNIGEAAFFHCEALANAVISNGVTIIGEEAFEYCSGLTNLTIPASVGIIGSYAFANLAYLTNVYFEGNAPTADSTVFAEDYYATAYRLATATGWPTLGSYFGGIPTAVWGQTSATVTLGDLSQTYTGSAISVTDTTIPSGLTVILTYNGSSIAPNNAGSYSVIGTISSATYQGSATNTLVINQVTPTINSLPIASAITYGQTLAPSTLSGGSASVGGSWAFTAPGTSPNAGTSLEDVTFTPSDTVNYYTITTSADVTVNKANATVILGNLTQTYSGAAINVTATTVPNGLSVNLTYNGSSNAPINAGSYTVIGTINNANYQGSATNTLVVGVPPLNLAGVKTNSNQLILELIGTPNLAYILQATTNLNRSSNWQPIFTNLADTNGNWSVVVTNLQNAPAEFFRAVATNTLVIGPTNTQAQNLFVIDEGSGNIYEFTPGGVQSTFASGMGEFEAMAFNSAGNLFAGAVGSGNIYEFTQGGVQSTFASEVSNPEGLGFNSAGVLFESVYGTGGINEFTPGGVRTTFATGLSDPYGLAFNSAGVLFVVDAGSGSIYEFTTSGAQSTFASGLERPAALAFNSAGVLFVADAGSGSIYEFTTSGAQSTFASGLERPVALAFNSAGVLFVADAGSGSIYEFTASGVQSTFASGLTPIYVAFQGVTLPVSAP